MKKILKIILMTINQMMKFQKEIQLLKKVLEGKN